MLGMKTTVNFDTSILTPVAVVNKEPKKQCTAVIPCGQIHDWIEEKINDTKSFRTFRLKRKSSISDKNKP